MQNRKTNILFVIVGTIVILSFIGNVCSAQSSFDSVFQAKTFAARVRIFDTLVSKELIKMDSLSYHLLLDSIDKRAAQESNFPVKIHSVLARYVYSDRKKLTNIDKKIAHLKGLLEEATEQKYPEYRALLLYDIGNNYFGQKKNNVAAFENYLAAYNIAKSYSSDAFPNKKIIILFIGNAYYRIGDYSNSKYMLLRADSIFSDNLLVDYNCKNTLGLIYREKGNFDSATYYFSAAHKIAMEANDSVWMGITNGNIGITHYLQGEHEIAIPLLKEDIRQCLNAGNIAYDNATNSLMVLADIYLTKRDFPSVSKLLDTALVYLPQSRDKVPLYAKYYPLKASYYSSQQMFKDAYQNQVLASRYLDSMYSRKNVFGISRLQIKYETEKNRAELKQLKAEKQYYILVRNALLLGVVFIFVLGLLLINRRRLQYKLAQNKLLVQQKVAEQDLANATIELERFTKHIQDKNAIIEKTSNELEKLQQTLDEALKKDIDENALFTLRSSTILTDNEWDDFRLLFDYVHKGYLQRLKEKMPDLSAADTRFIVLSKLQFTNKEMASVLGVAPDTIRTYKHRLRKKYNIPDDNSLNSLIDMV